MTIKFTGKKKPFDCVLVDNPKHTTERARWSDGYWSDICTGCMEAFKKNVSRVKAKKDPMWFLKPKSK